MGEPDADNVTRIRKNKWQVWPPLLERAKCRQCGQEKSLFCREPNVDSVGKKTNIGAALATLFCREPNVDSVGKKTNIGAALATLFCREPNVDRVGKKTNIGAALATLSAESQM